MGNEEYLSKTKYEELQVELKELKGPARKEVAEQLESAKALGDLSENAEYHEARDRQAEIEDRIVTLESILKRAVIIESQHGKTVGIGSEITVEKDGKKETYILVGSEEANTLQGKISHQSPLGNALMGKKKGDKIEVSTPRGELVYKIIDVK
ncbi:MAG: transcription elongation factor GreA [bacterium]|nr:transcription elongation factor GreA [bacterium]